MTSDIPPAVVRGRRQCRAWLAAFVVGALFPSAPAPAQTADKSGVRPTVLSRPGGPGSVEGLGKAFQPELNTGTATYGVSIKLPPGVAGHQPVLELRYSGGTGNGPLGLGWSLDIPRVERRTEKGVPRYNSPTRADDEDVFIFSGEELVPLADGSYRCENESGFVRFRKVASEMDGPIDAWEGALPDGRRYLFGASPGERVTRPGPGTSSFVHTFSWRLSRCSDPSGNTIEYRYERFDDSTGVLYPSTIEYARSGDHAHRVVFSYSGTPRYPDSRPDVINDFHPGFEVRTARLLREVAVLTDGQPVLRYVLDYIPEAAADPGTRPAAVSLLHGVTLHGRPAEGLDRPARYLPPMRFSYTGEDAERPPGSGDRGPARGGFHAVRGGRNLLRFDPANTTTIDMDADGLPDFVATGEGRWFAYRNLGGGRFGDEQVFERGPADGKRIDEPAITLADLDGDGRADLFHKGGGRFLVHRNPNSGDKRKPLLAWGAEEVFRDPDAAAGFGTTVISDPGLRLVDLDFDRRVDVVRPFPGGVEYVMNGVTRWHGELVFQGSDRRLPRDWSYEAARFDAAERTRRCDLADFNGDRLPDWYSLNVSDGRLMVDYWPNANGGAWAARRAMPRLAVGSSGLADDFLVLDVNADGLSDVVLVENRRLTWWVNMGGERWVGPVVRTDSPSFTKGVTVLRPFDVNGNGTIDLFWDDPSARAAGTAAVYFDFADGVRPNLLSGIDNGVGARTLIEYRSSTDDYLRAEQAGHPWATRVPFPVPVVSRIRLRIGLDLDGDGQPDETVTDYQYRDGYHDPIEGVFRGFAFVESIERGDDHDPVTGRTMSGTGRIHGPSLVTRRRFHTGAPDFEDNDEDTSTSFGPVVDEGTGSGRTVDPRRPDLGGREEETLRGRLVLMETVDPAALSDSEATFDAGAAHAAEATPGLPAGRRTTPDRYVYRREAHDWKVRRLYRPEGVLTPPSRFRDTPALVAKSVSMAVDLVTTIEVIEANAYLRSSLPAALATRPSARISAFPAVPSVVLRTERRYDNYGNTVREADYGVVDGVNVTAGHDERVRSARFALGGEALREWLVRRPAVERVEDAAGVFVAETRHYYDGDDFVGLPLGQVGRRGLETRRERVVTDDPGRLPALDAYDPPRLGHPGDPRLPAGSVVTEYRAAHDAWGNPVVQLSAGARNEDVSIRRDAAGVISVRPNPGGRGRIRIITYDDERHVYAISERVVLGSGEPDLVASADWDPALGVLTALTDFNGAVTAYRHDAFGRPVAVIRPGDRPDAPTTRYAYRPADPHRELVYLYDDAGNLVGNAPRAGQRPQPSAVETFSREDVSAVPGYRTSSRITYTSGVGQAIMTVVTGDQKGKWVITRLARFNRRGDTSHDAVPFEADSASYQLPRDNRAWTESYRDPIGRVIDTVHPPEDSGRADRSRVITLHIPLATWTHDEEDGDPASLHSGTPTLRRYDGLGRLTAVTRTARLDDEGNRRGGEPAEWTTAYGYDPLDHLASVRDAQDNVRWTRYDGMGRRIFMNDPDAGARTWRFDDASDLVEVSDARGYSLSYTYDGAGRVVTETSHFAPGPPQVVSYHYDRRRGDVTPPGGHVGPPALEAGMLAWVTDLSGERHFFHDERGRVRWTVRRLRTPAEVAGDYALGNEYDASDRRVRAIYPDGDAVRFTHTPRGLTEAVTNDGGSLTLAGFTYAPSRQITRRETADRIVANFNYDPRLRLGRHTATGPGDTVLIDDTYAYDRASNILRITDGRPATQVPDGAPRRDTRTFTYDDLNQLTGVSLDLAAPGKANRPSGTLNYSYDRIGNMLALGATGEYGRRAADQPTGPMGFAPRWRRQGRQGRDPGPHALTEAGPLRYAYDAAGNLIRSPGLTLEWDAWGRMAASRRDGGPTTTYTYDSEGTRVLKTTARNGSVLTTLYVAPEYERSSNGVVTKHAFVGGARQFTWTARLGSSLPNDARFYHTDHVGSTRVVTDERGRALDEIVYEPFGRRRYENVGNDPHRSRSPYLFAQKQVDPETGLYNFEARYLLAGLGRFASPDPILVQGDARRLADPQQLCAYGYAANNPLRFEDPSGESPLLVAAVVLTAYSMLIDNDPLNAPGPNDRTYPGKGVGQRLTEYANVAGFSYAIAKGSLMFLPRSSARKPSIEEMSPAEGQRYKEYWERGTWLKDKRQEALNPNTRQRDQVPPGWRSIKDQKLSEKTGEMYVRESLYDKFGRRTGENHFTTHDQPGHTSPHHHVVDPMISGRGGDPLPGLHPQTPP